MTAERTIANMFRMDDATWLHHANPWSMITRIPVLPFFVCVGIEMYSYSQSHHESDRLQLV
jgi:hypothetical protein